MSLRQMNPREFAKRQDGIDATARNPVVCPGVDNA